MNTVAFLLHAASPGQITGGEKSLVELAAGMARTGRRCLVVAPQEGMSTERARAAGLEVIRSRCRMLWLSHPLPLGRLQAVVRTAVFLAGWPALFRLRKLLRRLRPDLVHVNGIVHVWGAVAARSLGLPVVWHIREIVGGRIRRRLLTVLVGLLADRVVAVSRAVAAQFPAGRASVRVVYNGVEAGGGPPPERADGSTGPVRIGHAGQIQPQKGQRELIGAARRLRGREGPELRFLIAGAVDRNPEADRLRALLDSYRLNCRVELTGFLEDPRPFYRSLDLIAVTSTAPDPLPRVLAEAMMEGVPAVGFASGGITEMVDSGKTGLLVPPGDVDGLAEAIWELACRPDRRVAMGRAARSRAVELFSMESYIRHCVDVYAELGPEARGAGGEACS